MKTEQFSVSPNSNRNAIVAIVLDILSNLLFVVFVFFAVYGVFMYPSYLLFCLPSIAVSFFLRVLSARVNVSYDYTVSDGYFIVGKIISNKKRKDLFKLSAQDILRVTEIREHTRERNDKKIIVCTANKYPPEGKNFVLLETEEKLILIETDDILLNTLKNKAFF